MIFLQVSNDLCFLLSFRPYRLRVHILKFLLGTYVRHLQTTFNSDVFLLITTKLVPRSEMDTNYHTTNYKSVGRQIFYRERIKVPYLRRWYRLRFYGCVIVIYTSTLHMVVCLCYLSLLEFSYLWSFYLLIFHWSNPTNSGNKN